MEGEPAFSPVQKSVHAGGAEHITFVTYMLTYGDHMSNDVMGNEEDSWKEQLGLPAKVTGGMASMESIQSLYIDKMKTVMTQF
jgi:sirohydrochlorin cobaltochelatase